MVPFVYRELGIVKFSRYSFGFYEVSAWVECLDCGSIEQSLYVWQRSDGAPAANFEGVVEAIMRHEITSHAQLPK